MNSTNTHAILTTMFNRGDNRGFDLINHAIRMGTMGDMLGLRSNDILRQLNHANQAFIARPMQHDINASPTQPPAPAPQPASATGTSDSTDNDRLNANAFQFPWKLHDMLDNSASEGFEHVVSWQEDGRSFRVHKPPKFVDSVMPIYFKQTKYKSFQRQLNLYGFTRINEGPAKGGYRHKYFIRGQRVLCQLISRSASADGPVTPPPQPVSTTATVDDQQRTPSHQGSLGVKFQAIPSITPAVKISAVVHSAAKTFCARRTMAEESSSPEESANCDTKTAPPTVTSTSNTSSSIIEGSGGSTENANADCKVEDSLKSMIHREFQFPWKLHEMLEQTIVDSFEQIVSWQPGDICFKVHDPTKFVSLVMPRFFKQTKYKSFQRQLNLYGFVRIDEGPNKGAYHHKFFKKGRKDLLNKMTRQKVKNEKSSSEQEDKFKPEARQSPMETEVSSSSYLPSNNHIPVILAAIQCTEAALENGVLDLKDSVERLNWRQSPSESFSDWKIEVIEQGTEKRATYHVHRRVLAVGPKRSEYFARVLKRAQESNKTVLELGSHEASAFPLVLDHLYSDAQLHLDTRTAYALYSLAEQLEISSLLQAVTGYYSKNMTKENLVDFFTVAESFRDKTLLQAAIERCAEDLGSMDEECAGKLKPEILLMVLEQAKQLSQNYEYLSSRLSQLVAKCVDFHSTTLARDTFQRLTHVERLPHIQPMAAIRLLATQYKLLKRTQSVPQPAEISLQERCVSSITRDWDDVRSVVESDRSLSECMKSVSPEVLYDILMATTGRTSV